MNRNAKGARDDFFEALGFHLAQVRDASPWRVFRFRFPWLMVTVATGTICAILAGSFESNARPQSYHRVFSYDGARAKRKCQHAIDERDHTNVALRAANLALVRVRFPARTHNGNAARIRVRGICCADCHRLAR